MYIELKIECYKDWHELGIEQVNFYTIIGETKFHSLQEVSLKT